MVIMHVVAPCEFGGLERVVQMLGTGFGSLGHEVHVVSVVTECGAAEAFHGPLSEAGVATHEIVLSARSYARERAVIAALCQRLRPDAARRTLGIPRDDFVVGWVGRLSVEKGPDVLLEALPHLNTVPLTISLIGGGTGAEQGALRARADKLGVADHIRWHGVVPDAERVYTAFDVCVLSSRTEGTPVVLFEAMAAGVPVVATAVGGVPDVLSAEEAVLVASEDPVGLAAGIRDVYAHADAAARRARAARLRLEREFGVGPWLDRYAGIYRLITRGGGASAPVAA